MSHAVTLADLERWRDQEMARLDEPVDLTPRPMLLSDAMVDACLEFGWLPPSVVVSPASEKKIKAVMRAQG